MVSMVSVKKARLERTVVDVTPEQQAARQVVKRSALRRLCRRIERNRNSSWAAGLGPKAAQ